MTLTALPAGGYDGEAPVFPLPEAETPVLAHREAVVWAEAWKTPQAAAWASQSWRVPVVAEYVRLKTLCEATPNASLIAQLHRYRDQLGLTPAGLKENGWAVSVDELAVKAAEQDDRDARPKSSRDRMRVVGGGA